MAQEPHPEGEPAVEPEQTMPELETARLVLRGLRLEDAPDVLKYMSLPESADYAGASFGTLEEVEKRISDRLAEPLDQAMLWAVVEKDGGQVIGECRLHTIVQAAKRADLAYIIAPEQRGHGYAREAAEAVLDHGFNQLGLMRIEATVEPHNQASRKVVESLGMYYEGTLQNFWQKDGKPVSIRMYCLTPESFRNRALLDR